MSRCRTPCPCAYARASATCRATRATLRKYGMSDRLSHSERAPKTSVVEPPGCAGVGSAGTTGRSRPSPGASQAFPSPGSLGNRPGLSAEPLQPAGVGQALEWEHLQRHVPAQRLLDRLVDDPHAAAGHLAEDAVLPELLRHGAVRRGGLRARAGRPGRDRAELLD